VFWSWPELSFGCGLVGVTARLLRLIRQVVE
jgi:hypothetical protein